MAREIDRKDKGKSAAVDRLLAGPNTLYTQQVIECCLRKKFKVPQIQSYAGIGDPVEHLENFQVHLDLQGTPDAVACRAFLLNLTGNALDWF